MSAGNHATAGKCLNVPSVTFDCDADCFDKQSNKNDRYRRNVPYCDNSRAMAGFRPRWLCGHEADISSADAVFGNGHAARCKSTTTLKSRLLPAQPESFPESPFTEPHRTNDVGLSMSAGM